MNFEKLEIGICDDKEEDLAEIERALRQCMAAMGAEATLQIRCFTSGRQLYEQNLKCQFNLVFLDWEMPEWNGFELANRLNMKNPTLNIIFVSIHESMVFDAYEYTPLWFVRKSSLERDMVRAMQKYFEVTAHTLITYRIKDGLGYREIRIKDIMYIESSNHTLLIYLTYGAIYEVYKSLSAMEEEFSKNNFLRIHKSYLVNQAYIEEIERKSVRLKSGIELPMGKERKKHIREEMILYERRHG